MPCEHMPAKLYECVMCLHEEIARLRALVLQREREVRQAEQRVRELEALNDHAANDARLAAESHSTDLEHHLAEAQAALRELIAAIDADTADDSSIDGGYRWDKRFDAALATGRTALAPPPPETPNTPKGESH